MSEYPNIDKYLSGWVARQRRWSGDEYATLAHELDTSDTEDKRAELVLLDNHLGLASQMCEGFERLILEKKTLGNTSWDANRALLDKLAEIRAIWGLYRLGFVGIRFGGTPDLHASKNGQEYGVEVHRLGPVTGRKAQVWNDTSQLTGAAALRASGIEVKVMSSGGELPKALGESLYRTIKDKNRQLKRIDVPGIVWVSLGRDYWAAGLYETPGIGASVHMVHTLRRTLASAFDSAKSDGSKGVAHAVLCRGRELEDFVYPPLPNLVL